MCSERLMYVSHVCTYNATDFVQEYEKSRFAAMESEFRTRSDEAPGQMRKIQDKTRVSIYFKRFYYGIFCLRWCLLQVILDKVNHKLITSVNWHSRSSQVTPR